MVLGSFVYGGGGEMLSGWRSFLARRCFMFLGLGIEWLMVVLTWRDVVQILQWCLQYAADIVVWGLVLIDGTRRLSD